MSKKQYSVTWQERISVFLGISIQIIGVVFAARLITDMSSRMLYSFIPPFSSGLGITVAGYGWLLFIRALSGITSPFFGSLSDHYGRRNVMVGSFFLQAAGAAGMALSQGWWSVIPFILSGLAVAAFMPAQLAYISDRVSYQKRGRAMGSVEFAWSGSAIVALPFLGWTVDIYGWRTPLLIVAFFSLCGAFIVWRYLPVTPVRHAHGTPRWREIRIIAGKRNVIASMGVSFLLFAAATSFFTLWSIWMSEDFGLGATMLGLVGTGIGIAELLGVVLSSGFIDRLGKKRGSSLAFLLLLIITSSLLFSGSSLYSALAMLFISGLLYQFTIVSLLPLYSVQLPEASGTVLSLVFLGISVGAAVGSPLTTSIWARWGLVGVGVVDILLLLGALGLLRTCLHEEKASGS